MHLAITSTATSRNNSFSRRLLNKALRMLREGMYLTGTEKWLYNYKPSGAHIVMYHNVMPDGYRPTNLRQISQSDFARQLRYLQKRFRILTLREAFTYKVDNPAVAITFDDALVNNLRYALPVLEALSVPATIFACAIEQRGMHTLWPDALNFILRHRKLPVLWNNSTFNRQRDGMFVNEESLNLTTALRQEPLEKIWAIIERLDEQGEKPWFQESNADYLRVMNRDELRQMAGHPLIEIGSHGVSHVPLDSLTASELRTELTESKTYLESVTGTEVLSLAYPFGLYNDQVLSEAERAGYKYQLAVALHKSTDADDLRLRSRFGFFSDRSWIEQLHDMNTEIRSKH